MSVEGVAPQIGTALRQLSCLPELLARLVFVCSTPVDVAATWRGAGKLRVAHRPPSSSSSAPWLLDAQLAPADASKSF